MRVVLVALIACSWCACTKHEAKKPDAPVVVDAGVAHKALTVGEVLGIVTRDAPSVEVSVQDQHGDVALDLKGAGPPSLALAQLTSLPQRLPDVRAQKLVLGDDNWSASLVVPAHAESLAPPLVDVMSAVKSVFDALLKSGTVDVATDKLSFTGTLQPNKTIADAGAAVPAGWTLARVDLGASFALDLKRAAR